MPTAFPSIRFRPIGSAGLCVALAVALTTASVWAGEVISPAARRLGDGTLPSAGATRQPTAEPVQNELETVLSRRDAILDKTAELYQRASAAYSIGEYKLCVSICDQIIRIQQNHAEARKLRYSANVKLFRREAAHVDQESLQETEKDAIPPKSLIPLKRQTDMRDEAIKKYESESMNAIQLALDEKVTMSFSEADLEYVLNVLFKLNNINIIIDSSVVKDEKITILVREMPLRDILKFIARQKPNLEYTVTENAVWFHAPQQPLMVPRVYPIHSGLMTPGSSTATSGVTGGTTGGTTGGATNNSLRYNSYASPNRERTFNGPEDGEGDDSLGGGLLGGGGLVLPQDIQDRIRDEMARRQNGGQQGGQPGGQPAAGGATGGATTGGGGGGHSVGDSYLEKALEFMGSWQNDWPSGTQWMIDRKSNQLLVYTTPEFHKQIIAMLDVIDHPAPQVLIKTRFIEVKLADSFAFGFDAIDATGNNSDAKITFGRTTTDSDGNTSSVAGFGGDLGISAIAGQLTGGATFAIAGVRTDPLFNLQMKLIAGDSRARILSAPQIIAVNNQSSEIFIGDKLQYVSRYREVTRTTTTDGAQSSEISALVPDEFEDLDLGFNLVVTPSIGRDMKTIVLDLKPEINELAAGQTLADFGQSQIIMGEGSGTGDMTVKRPTTNERRLHTKVTIQDNGYIIIGGLIRNRQEERESRVPYISRLPFIGELFKSRAMHNDRSNLIIVVEAKIIDPAGRGLSDETDAPLDDAAARRLEDELLTKLEILGEVDNLNSRVPASLR
ncbi:MAG: hypothetical protein ABIH86_06705 [Planctomycetota bacterium]